MAVAETLRGMSLGDMMEEEREEVVDVAVVEGEGETAVEVAAAEEAAASATKAEVNVTVKAEAEVEAQVEAEAEAETEEEWHEAAEPEQDWFYQIASGRVVGPVGWAELLCAWLFVRGAGGRAVIEEPPSARPTRCVVGCRERADPHPAMGMFFSLARACIRDDLRA